MLGGRQQNPEGPRRSEFVFVLHTIDITGVLVHPAIPLNCNGKQIKLSSVKSKQIDGSGKVALVDLKGFLHCVWIALNTTLQSEHTVKAPP